MLKHIPIGTRSLLFGAHAFYLHPWFVAWAWKKLYGWPLDPRLWAAFVVHDWGYWSVKTGMDTKEGEKHPEVGGRIMRRLFGEKWGDFTRLHSRYYAKAEGRQYSRLCVADKLAFCLTPAWMYLPMARASGEIYEYLLLVKGTTNPAFAPLQESLSYQLFCKNHSRKLKHFHKVWYNCLSIYMEDVVVKMKDGAEDTWTKVRHKQEEPCQNEE